MIIDGQATSTDVCEGDVGMLEDAWKPYRAIRDEQLAVKLCNALERILARKQTSSDSSAMARYFSPALEAQNIIWQWDNESEAQVRHRFLFCSCLTSNFSLLTC